MKRILLALIVLVVFASASRADWLNGFSYRNRINATILNQTAIAMINPVFNESGLVGSWHFDETSGNEIFDASGYSNNGTIFSATRVSGKSGNALSFVGTQYVSITDPGTTSLDINGPFTIMSWIKLSGPSNGGAGNILRKDSSYCSGVSGGSSPVGGGWIYTPGLCGTWGIGATVLKFGRWYHYTMVYNTSNIIIYIDGAYDGKTSCSGNPSLVTDNIGIGARLGYTEYFNGTIDELKIYNRVLSESEISDRYQKAKGNYEDMRITTNDGFTLLPYYIENDNKIWVKYIGQSAANSWLYAYYGSPDTESQSSQDSTFIFYDDFESGTESEWTDSTNSWSVTGAQKYRGRYSYYGYDSSAANGANINPKNSTGTINLNSGIVEMEVRFGENNMWHFPMLPNGAGTASSYHYMVVAKNDGHWGYYNGVSYNNFPVDTLYSASTWYRLKCAFSAPMQTYWVWIDGNLVTPSGIALKNNVGTTIPTDGQLMLNMLAGDGAGSTQDMWIDDYGVREFTLNDINTTIVAEDTFSTSVGTSTDWSWKIPSVFDTIRSGSPESWNWGTIFFAGVGNYEQAVNISLVPNGSMWVDRSSWDSSARNQYSGPAFGDLNNDGLLDLLVGDSWGGVAAYRNTGTATSPTWTYQSTWNVSFADYYSKPALGDLDEDGDLDLIVGYNVVGAYTYENTGNPYSPIWTRKASWDVPTYANYERPVLVDLDDDGDLDFLGGSTSNYVYAYENTGTRYSPSWTDKNSWDIPNIPYSVADISAADMDGDGDYDMLVGTSGSETLYAYENTGTRKSPSWSRRASWDFTGSGGIWYGSPAFADIDSDNDLDLFVGEDSGFVHGVENTDRRNVTVPMVFDSQSLISSGKMKPDCTDLNVLDAYRTVVSYWLEEGCNTTSTLVWAIYPNLLPGNKTAYIDYDSNIIFSSSDYSGKPIGLYTGTGRDGNCTVSSNINISRDSCVGRANGDAVRFSTTTNIAVGSSTLTTSASPTGLAAGDEVVIIDLQSSVDVNRVGRYELKTISSISGSNLYFDTPFAQSFDGSTDDIMVQRVPNYYNMSVNSGVTLFAAAWDGTTGGVIFFRVKNKMAVDGTITIVGMGYRGGYHTGYCTAVTDGGEGRLGYATSGGGGYASGYCGSPAPGGGGGGHATGGNGGGTGGGGTPGSGGSAYGNAQLDKLLFGSGGGDGINFAGGTSGGAGGGIIFIAAKDITVTGVINASGQPGVSGWGTDHSGRGGGAGGSILIEAETMTLGTNLVTAAGAVGGGNTGVHANGGTGGSGRIALYYAKSLSGTTNPAAGYSTTVPSVQLISISGVSEIPSSLTSPVGNSTSWTWI